ncbi:MAG: hypothetical protein ACI9MF_000420, partial [Gammaproteobacteria bacterium]
PKSCWDNGFYFAASTGKYMPSMTNAYIRASHFQKNQSAIPKAR